MAKKKSNAFETFCGVIFVLFFLFSWLTIPDEKGHVDGFRIASLAFVNAVFDGWADDIAVQLLHSDSTYSAQLATSSFRDAILLGEREYRYPVIAASILGAFLSLGGVLAVWLARSAANPTQAFYMGFWAEIIETVVFLVGYYRTVGIWVITPIDVVVTLVIAVIMGGVAFKLNKAYRQSASSA